MSSLTYKLFDKLSEQNESIKVDELLKYFTDRESTEYQQVVDASQDPVGRTEKLKTLVLKSYRDKKLKDLQFFKYLAWSEQSNLCKLIGYNDKQIAKWMREKPTHSDGKPYLQTAGNDIVQNMETDQGLSGVTAATILKIPSSNADMSSVQDVTDRPIYHEPAHVHATTQPAPKTLEGFTAPNLSKMPSGTMVTNDSQGDDDLVVDGPIRLEPATVRVPLPQQQLGHCHSEMVSRPAYIVYSKEDSDDVQTLSDFLRDRCGIDCNIDQYYTTENVIDWAHWNEQAIKNCASSKGFVLLVCSPKMLSHYDSKTSERIQMRFGHIDNLSLRSLIKEHGINEQVIPVLLDKYQMPSDYCIPSNLKERSRYLVSISELQKVDPQADADTILDTQGLQSLRSLVCTLRGIPAVDKPLVRKEFTKL